MAEEWDGRDLDFGEEAVVIRLKGDPAQEKRWQVGKTLLLIGVQTEIQQHDGDTREVKLKMYKRCTQCRLDDEGFCKACRHGSGAVDLTIPPGELKSRTICDAGCGIGTWKWGFDATCHGWTVCIAIDKKENL